MFKKTNPDRMYIVVLAFFIASAGLRYAGEYLYSVIAEPPGTAEQAP